MRQNRGTVIGWIGLSEGGYVNHPRDPGGATDRGITQRTFDAWNDLRGQPKRSVRGISRDTAEEILATQYLDSVRFDDLPAGVDYAVADYSVNSGPGRAAKELQRVLGVDPDGVIGSMTLAALASANPETVVADLCARRMAFLRNLTTWDAFGAGWSVRVVGRTDGFQENDIGVLDRSIMLARSAANIPAPVTVAQGRGEAEGPRAVSVFRDPAMIAAAAPIVGTVATMAGGEGPVQYALAAVLVVLAVAAVFVVTRRAKTAEALA